MYVGKIKKICELQETATCSFAVSIALENIFLGKSKISLRKTICIDLLFALDSNHLKLKKSHSLSNMHLIYQSGALELPDSTN
ncbi:hypothetical protein DID88_006022 [Monilinia fructigena]|uniref:Uncharacterized protein n=1 Tax=Monilinia fructigena TaxID=38457 RepID=A0A395J3Z1_9HELO|nr:hypothetical protein DID88_006022 [Monilinia fructigena]